MKLTHHQLTKFLAALFISTSMACGAGANKTEKLPSKTDNEPTKAKDSLENTPISLTSDTFSITTTLISAEESGTYGNYLLEVDTPSAQSTLYYEDFNYAPVWNLVNKTVDIVYCTQPTFSFIGLSPTEDKKAVTELASKWKDRPDVQIIKGTYKTLSFGGDLPGKFAVITDAKDTLIFEQYFEKQERPSYENREVTCFYSVYNRQKVIRITESDPFASIEVTGNIGFIGDWQAGENPNGIIRIRYSEDFNGYLINFNGDYFGYDVDMTSDTIKGQNFSGNFTLYLDKSTPGVLSYSDDGRGHFEPLTDVKYTHKNKEDLDQLRGVWKEAGSDQNTLLFSANQVLFQENGYTRSGGTYTICPDCIYNSDYFDASEANSISDSKYINFFGFEEDYCYEILKLTTDSLFLGAVNGNIYVYSR